MENKLVTIKSTISAPVGLIVPSHNFKRQWTGANTVHKIPFGTLQEIYYDPGAQYLFNSGILAIDDMDVKIALGMEEEGTVEPTKVIALTPARQNFLLRKADAKEFEDALEELSKEQIDELAKKATLLKIADMNKLKALGDKTKTDLISFIRENEEE